MIQGVTLNPLVTHPDERGFFREIIRNQDAFFQEGFGQLSHSHMVDGVVKAWHIHKTQIDWWYIVTGLVKVVLYDSRSNSKTYKTLDEYIFGNMDDKSVLKIPPGVAHGLKVLQGPADLIYITSASYNPDEEGRIKYDDPTIGYDWVQGKPISNLKIT
jgi:dTDP-4-dehydrorhamnose 3,5-epimerase